MGVDLLLCLLLCRPGVGDTCSAAPEADVMGEMLLDEVLGECCALSKLRELHSSG